MNSGPELGFGHKIDKVLKFGDDFDLQLEDEETHCSVNAVKGTLRNNS